VEKLIRALNKIGVDELLSKAKKEANDFFIRGLFECGRSMNENIMVVEEYLKKVDKLT